MPKPTNLPVHETLPENTVLAKVPFHRQFSTVSGMRITLQETVVRALQTEMKRWLEVVNVDERTWIGKNFKIPSFLSRVDCITDSACEELKIVCEIEEPPAGALLASRINPQFRSLLKKAQASWPEFKALVADYRISDVGQWLGWHTLQNAHEHDGLFWVSCRPQDKSFYPFSDRSVTPIRLEGLKTYLPELKYGKASIFRGTVEELDLNSPLMIKTIQGTRCLDVLPWWPDRNNKPRDAISFSQLERALQNNSSWILQPFVRAPLLPPEISKTLESVSPEYNNHAFLCRVYFGYCPEKKKHLPLGGVWNSRPKHFGLIHGKDDSILGPLTLPEQCIDPFFS